MLSWLAGGLSVCGKHFNVAIFLDTINTTNVEVCVMVVLIYTTFSGLLCISRSQQCQTVLTDNVTFLSDHVETLYYC